MGRKKTRDQGLIRAICEAGSISALANRIKVTVQAVSQWERVPVGRCLEIERELGVPRSVLRPDVFTPASPEHGRAA